MNFNYGEPGCRRDLSYPYALQQINEEDIKTYCKGKISHQKIPKYIKFVDEFPMTATGKIQKFRMKEIYAEELNLK